MNADSLTPTLDAHFDAMPPRFREDNPAVRALVREAVTERAARAYREASSAMGPHTGVLPVYAGAELRMHPHHSPVVSYPVNTRLFTDKPVAMLTRDPYARAWKITPVEDDPEQRWEGHVRRAVQNARQRGNAQVGSFFSVPAPELEEPFESAPADTPWWLLEDDPPATGTLRACAAALVVYAVLMLAALMLLVFCGLYVRRVL